MNSGWTGRCCWGFMMYISWSVTPNQRWLAEWRLVVSNTRQTLQIRSSTLELIANTQRESRQSASLSLSLNLSLNSLSLFLSFRLTAIKLGNEFPRVARPNELQEPACLRCNGDVSLRTSASRDGCFLWDWAARVWASSYPLQLSVAPTFSPGGVQGGGGKGSWQSPALTHPLDYNIRNHK